MYVSEHSRHENWGALLDLYVTVMIEEQQRQRQAPIDDVIIAVFFLPAT